MTPVVGLFGKLPSKGDFVSRGLDGDFLAQFEPWLAAVMEDARAVLADDWAAVYDAAPIWRFWIGPEAGLTGCAGVMAAARDRVGRRFPLVLVAPDTLPQPPSVAQDEGWYAALEAALDQAFHLDAADDPQDVLADLPPPDQTYEAPQPGTHGAFWAVGPMPEQAADSNPAPVLAEPASDGDPAPEPEPWIAGEEDASPFDTDGKLAPVAAFGGEDRSPFDGNVLTAVQAELAKPDMSVFAVNAPLAPEDDSRPAPEISPPDRADPFVPDAEAVVDLMAEAARTEARVTAATRSYWSTTGGPDCPPAFVAMTGLPDGAALAALLGGFRAAALANEVE